MLGPDGIQEIADTPQSRVDKIFAVMDKVQAELSTMTYLKNNDGVITRQEFVEGAKHDGDILRAITLYDDILWDYLEYDPLLAE